MAQLRQYNLLKHCFTSFLCTEPTTIALRTSFKFAPNPILMISLMCVINADSEDSFYVNLRYVIAMHSITLPTNTEGTEIQMIDAIIYRVKQTVTEISKYWELVVSSNNNFDGTTTGYAQS